MSNQPSKVQTAIDTAREEIGKLLDREPSFGPQFIRIAFYDAISYNPSTKEDGPNASIRLWEGLAHDNEMKEAITKLDTLKAGDNYEVWPHVSYADLYQLAGVVAVEKAKGPKIEFQHGRPDLCKPINASKLQILSQDSYEKLVDTFHQFGFTDKEIVALSWAFYYWKTFSSDKQPIMDKGFFEKLLRLKNEVFESKVDSGNSTSNAPTTPMDKQKQPSKSTTSSPFDYWKCLVSDASFCKHVELFAKDEKLLAKDYASAHKKLSELGFKYFPQSGIPTKAEYQDIKHGIAFAMAMTILFGVVGFFYEIMRT